MVMVPEFRAGPRIVLLVPRFESVVGDRIISPTCWPPSTYIAVHVDT